MLSEHVTFDILAWLAALATAWGVWRWRLAEIMDQLTGRLGRGYFIALAVVVGSWSVAA